MKKRKIHFSDPMYERKLGVYTVALCTGPRKWKHPAQLTWFEKRVSCKRCRKKLGI